ncbi:PPC domain-containing protein [Jidongwangia harbinensis]|uniref:PPC domain-containing protein n=1 Tax=Jidongwangia harbinensis TaxID=2878561 RepID=UPI001CD9B898|nr:PPC domain-containing protein [Jidongwangia harbinensis]MCA2212108.1 PPC domain-containing protein [Jidongwangia harbinensis]
MRRSIATAGAVLLGLVALTPGAAPGAPSTPDPGLSPAEKAAQSVGISVTAKAAPGKKPAGPNPFLALLPEGSKADYSGWARYMSEQAAKKAQAKLRAQAAPGARAAASPLLADEDEPDGTRGANDNPASAQRINGFGTAANQNSKLRILGQLDPEAVAVETVAANAEDDGSIPLAGDTGIGESRGGIETSAEIGDGPHGSAGSGSGDFDFYRVQAEAGEVLTVQTATPTGELDTIAAVYSADGELLVGNDDFGGELDSRVTYRVPAAGTFYVLVSGFFALPADPNDSGSGEGAGSEGPYSVTITAGEADQDFFAVKLRAGDVIGSTVKGAATYLTVYDTVPREVHGSDQDASFIFPAESPLPGGGNATTDYVATEAGWHYVGVSSGDGNYDVTVEAYRPTLQGDRPNQTLFLDFDGARVNTAIGGWGGPGVRQLSPLAAFLAQWGLTRDQEDELIDAIVASVSESIKHDLAEAGLNGKFKLKILNSRDHADPWGQANVSRIVVGGTIEESGVPTIGIAESIDPGNFATEETALVLLDVLSEPTGPETSLNTYMTSASDRVAFVGQAVGNVTAHEAGHFFGNWHTDNTSEHVNLMDSGGANYQNLYGVGPDGVGGTADDPDVDFGDDVFSAEEGFVGTEDTLGRIVFGVTS